MASPTAETDMAYSISCQPNKDKGLKDPSNRKHRVNLKSVANEYAGWYAKYKAEQKAWQHRVHEGPVRQPPPSSRAKR